MLVFGKNVCKELITNNTVNPVSAITGTIMRSDVGFAMGAIGSDIAVENADVVIMNDDPAKVYDAVKIARIARRTAIFNIIFALFVKAVVAALVMIPTISIPMMVPVIADTGLTVVLVINSLLILYRKIR